MQVNSACSTISQLHVNVPSTKQMDLTLGHRSLIPDDDASPNFSIADILSTRYQKSDLISPVSPVDITESSKKQLVLQHFDDSKSKRIHFPQLSNEPDPLISNNCINATNDKLLNVAQVSTSLPSFNGAHIARIGSLKPENSKDLMTELSPSAAAKPCHKNRRMSRSSLSISKPVHITVDGSDDFQLTAPLLTSSVASIRSDHIVVPKQVDPLSHCRDRVPSSFDRFVDDLLVAADCLSAETKLGEAESVINKLIAQIAQPVDLCTSVENLSPDLASFSVPFPATIHPRRPTSLPSESSKVAPIFSPFYDLILSQSMDRTFFPDLFQPSPRGRELLDLCNRLSTQIFNVKRKIRILQRARSRQSSSGRSSNLSALRSSILSNSPSHNLVNRRAAFMDELRTIWPGVDIAPKNNNSPTKTIKASKDLSTLSVTADSTIVKVTNQSIAGPGSSLTPSIYTNPCTCSLSMLSFVSNLIAHNEAPSTNGDSLASTTSIAASTSCDGNQLFRTSQSMALNVNTAISGSKSPFDDPSKLDGWSPNSCPPLFIPSPISVSPSSCSATNSYHPSHAAVCVRKVGSTKRRQVSGPPELKAPKLRKKRFQSTTDMVLPAVTSAYTTGSLNISNRVITSVKADKLKDVLHKAQSGRNRAGKRYASSDSRSITSIDLDSEAPSMRMSSPLPHWNADDDGNNHRNNWGPLTLDIQTDSIDQGGHYMAIPLDQYVGPSTAPVLHPSVTTVESESHSAESLKSPRFHRLFSSTDLAPDQYYQPSTSTTMRSSIGSMLVTSELNNGTDSSPLFVSSTTDKLYPRPPTPDLRRSDLDVMDLSDWTRVLVIEDTHLRAGTLYLDQPPGRLPPVCGEHLRDQMFRIQLDADRSGLTNPRCSSRLSSISAITDLSSMFHESRRRYSSPTTLPTGLQPSSNHCQSSLSTPKKSRRQTDLRLYGWQVVQQAVREVLPSSVSHLPPGTRVCASWSEQLAANLYPGTVVKAYSNEEVPSDCVPVDFDDGDHRQVPIGNIRMLPDSFSNLYELSSVTHRKTVTDAPRRQLFSSTVESDIVGDSGPSLLLTNGETGAKHFDSQPVPTAHQPIHSEEETQATATPIGINPSAAESPSTTLIDPELLSDSTSTTVSGCEASSSWHLLQKMSVPCRGRHARKLCQSIIREPDGLVISLGDSVEFSSGGDEVYLGEVRRIRWDEIKQTFLIKAAWYYNPSEVGRHGDLVLNMTGAVFSSEHEDENEARCINRRVDVLPSYTAFLERLRQLNDINTCMQKVHGNNVVQPENELHKPVNRENTDCHGVSGGLHTNEHNLSENITEATATLADVKSGPSTFLHHNGSPLNSVVVVNGGGGAEFDRNCYFIAAKYDLRTRQIIQWDADLSKILDTDISQNNDTPSVRSNCSPH